MAHDALAAIRDDIMAQPAQDRVDYALDILEYYLAPAAAFATGCAALGIVLPRADLRILHMLDRRRGSLVTLEALVAARYFDRAIDHWGRDARVYDAISKIRGEFDRCVIPAQIETWAGVGYRLTAPAGFTFEQVDPFTCHPRGAAQGGA